MSDLDDLAALVVSLGPARRGGRGVRLAEPDHQRAGLQRRGRVAELGRAGRRRDPGGRRRPAGVRLGRHPRRGRAARRPSPRPATTPPSGNPTSTPAWPSPTAWRRPGARPRRAPSCSRRRPRPRSTWRSSSSGRRRPATRGSPGVRVATYSDAYGEMAVATTTGIAVDERRRALLPLGEPARRGPGRHPDRVGHSRRRGRRPSSTRSGRPRTASSRAVRLLGAAKPASRRVTVVLDPEVTADLLADPRGRPCRGRRCSRGARCSPAARAARSRPTRSRWSATRRMRARSTPGTSTARASPGAGSR